MSKKRGMRKEIGKRDLVKNLQSMSRQEPVHVQ